MAPPAAWSRAVAGGPRPQDTGSRFPGRRSGAGLERTDPGNARPVSGAAGRRSRLGPQPDRHSSVRLQLRPHAVWVLPDHGHARGVGEAVQGRYLDRRPRRRAVEADGLARNGDRHLQPGHGSPEGCGSRFEDVGGVPAAEVTGRAQRVISTMARAGAIAPSMYSVTPGSQILISLNMEQSLNEPA